MARNHRYSELYTILTQQRKRQLSTPPSQNTRSIMSWSALPLELRREVFRHLEINKQRTYKSPKARQAERLEATQSKRGIHANYAAINREWQAHFEVRNFEFLTLESSDIDDFKEIISSPRRGGCLYWIWLRVELLDYGCDKCGVPESEQEQRQHQVQFTVAVWGLLHHLHRVEYWQRGTRPSEQERDGITFELSAHSPSDAEHHCQELMNTVNDSMWDISDDYRIDRPNDRSHGWRNGQRRCPISEGTNARLFGTPQGLGVDVDNACIPHWKRQPKPTLVRELVIRLQFLRHFSIRKGLGPIIDCLPRLQSLLYECRQGINSGRPLTGQTRRQMDHRQIFYGILSSCKTLTKLALYEHHNHPYSPVPPTIAPDPAAGIALGSQSSHLHEIYVSWMVDAKDFLYSF